MERGTRRLAFIVGAVAAAAGVAVASYLYFHRHNEDEPPLRSVSDVLTDAYTKMREIQSHLTEMHPPNLQPSQGT